MVAQFLKQPLPARSVEGTLSSPSNVVSGVPQGSVLGPLLFLIMIGDIDRDLKHSNASSFADDTRVGKEIRDEADAEKLQEDLDAMVNWANENNMALNEDKFELIRYGQDQVLKSRTGYKCNGQPIVAKETVRDLGVHMSEDLTFSKHIEVIVENGRRQSGWVLRTFRTRDRACMLTLWKALIRPKLDYCCQLWSPHKIGDIIKLEAVQRTFTSRIRGMEHLNYWERLEELGLYSLQRRRERYTIMYIWKILEGVVPNVGMQVNYHPRRGRLCFVRSTEGTTQRVRTIAHNSFTYTGTRLFNSAPKWLRDLSGITPDQFKRQLDRWLATVPDQPPTPGYSSPHPNTLQYLVHERRGGQPGVSGDPFQLSH